MKQTGAKQIDANVLLSKIHELKIAQNSMNTDYSTGYRSALSTIEGYIAVILDYRKDDDK